MKQNTAQGNEQYYNYHARRKTAPHGTANDSVFIYSYVRTALVLNSNGNHIRALRLCPIFG